MEPEESSLKEKTKEYPSIRTLQLIGTDEGYVGKGSKKKVAKVQYSNKTPTYLINLYYFLWPFPLIYVC